MNTFIKLIFILTALLFSTNTVANELFTLENLERERAEFLNNNLTADLAVKRDIYAINAQKKRLIDMERMVIRDERLVMSNSIMAKNAFEQYELSFLMHASHEDNRLVVDHWLTQVNFTRAAISQGTIGER